MKEAKQNGASVKHLNKMIIQKERPQHEKRKRVLPLYVGEVQGIIFQYVVVLMM